VCVWGGIRLVGGSGWLDRGLGFGWGDPPYSHAYGVDQSHWVADNLVIASDIRALKYWGMRQELLGMRVGCSIRHVESSWSVRSVPDIYESEGVSSYILVQAAAMLPRGSGWYKPRW